MEFRFYLTWKLRYMCFLFGSPMELLDLENGGSRWILGDISFRSGDTMYFSVYYSEFKLEKLFPVAILVFRVVR